MSYITAHQVTDDDGALHVLTDDDDSKVDKNEAEAEAEDADEEVQMKHNGEQGQADAPPVRRATRGALAAGAGAHTATNSCG
jgi:hypothetical protein